MGISRLNPSSGGIPYGNTAGRPANPGVGKLYSNGELQRLELYTGSTYGWQNIVAETPGVTGYTGSVIETNTTNTITITGTNFASGATATLIGTDGTEYTATNTIVSNLTSITATFGPVSASLEPYDIRVTNPSNLYGVYYDILTVNDKPIWTTAAGSLGTYSGQSVSIQLAATDEENNSLTYSLVSGSLPTGLTLSSSGLISGTNSSLAGTYTFTVSVSDSNNNPQSRIFSILSSGPSVTGGTLTSDSTYYYRTFTGNGNLVITGSSLTCDYLVVGGGASGGGAEGGVGSGGGGAGGLYFENNSTFNSGTYAISIGAGASANPSTNGTNTTFNNKIAYGGGAASNNAGVDGTSGGSGGGVSRDSSRTGGAATQPSSPTGGYGNAGGSGQATTYAGGGGGGGAGAAGGMGSPTGPAGSGGNPGDYYAGNGGIGLTNSLINAIGAATSTGQLSGGNYYYAGGGGGGAFQMVPSNLSSYGLGGLGGGGIGGNGYDNRGGYSGLANYRTGGSGLSNTGGGGGGVIGSGYGGGTGGTGGSGVVVVRYTKSQVGG